MAIKRIRARGRTRYRVDYRDPATKKRTSRTFDTEREAKIFDGEVASAKNGITEMPRAKSSNMTLGQFAGEYYNGYVLVELAPATQALYKTIWNRHIVQPLGAVPLSQLDRQAIQRFKVDLVSAGAGAATVNKALALLSAICRKAVEWDKMAYNPVQAIKKQSLKRKHAVQAMDQETVSKLLELLPEHHRLYVALLAYAGLRPGEALALHGSDVRNGAIHVTKAISFGSEKDTKTGRDRSVPILEPLDEYLTDLPQGPLFAHSDGSYWTDSDYRNWRKRTFKKALQQLGDEWANFRPYDLRHSVASRLLMAGYQPLEVAQIMGHSVQVLFNTYSHVIASMRFRRDAIAA